MNVRTNLVGREQTLDTMKTVIKEKTQGRCHMFLSGPAACGKSSILKAIPGEDVDVLFLSVNMSHTVATPEMFARNFVNQLLAQLSAVQTPFICRDSASLKDRASCDGGERSLHVSSAIVPLKAIVERLSEGDVSICSMMEEIFSLPERISKSMGKRVVMIYDDFEHILELTTYRELKNLFSILTSTMKRHTSVSYIISGNRSVIAAKILTKNTFFRDRFLVVKVAPLSREASYFLTSSIIGRGGARVPRELLMAVYRFSQGYPPYIKALCERSMAISSSEKTDISSIVVARAFIDEVLSCSGLIYRECHNRYFSKLALVSGTNSLKAVLQILSQEEGITLSQIGRRMNRARGQVFGYVKSLVECDLIVARGKKYFFSDPLFRFFIAYSPSFFHSPALSTREALRWSGIFIRDYLCNRPWLPFALYDKIENCALRFHGEVVQGHSFGSRKTVRLPQCKTVEPLVGIMESEKGTRDIVVSDLWIRGQRRHWMVEVHCGEDFFTVDDYTGVKGKRTFFERSTKHVFDRLWIVSESGFTDEAMDQMTGDRVLFSSADSDFTSFEVVSDLDVAA